ncbi:MAG: ImmA/IrrE family metallo-endopeptidase [Candidatus Hydrogenedentes bacterium]|nr:ImmA/IrrE family metallo-endopeptidase [Candidatus Hydrogenedentota bacterium]
MNRVEVNPELFSWALARSRKSVEDLEKRFPKLHEWLANTIQPTVKQLRNFASATSTPFGYFFLRAPPEEPLPIPDFRTLADSALRSPSADLLDTLYTMQRRQEWLRETLIEREAEPLGFVDTATLQDEPEAIAQEMRRTCGLDDGWSKDVRTWKEAVLKLRRAIEEIGVMAVINGIVGNNTHRKLDVQEFRGFALSDEYAPLIFVNGADAKSAQMFTLPHELAHVWLGRPGVSGFEGLMPDGDEVELFCNRVAAEFLIPRRELSEFWREAKRTDTPFETIARRFKVSPIVAARRAMDLKFVSRETFFKFYRAYTEGEAAEERRRKAKKQSGGDFYNNQNTRVGEYFGTEIVLAAKEGRLLYSDAYKLTNLYGETFARYTRRLGFDM